MLYFIILGSIVVFGIYLFIREEIALAKRNEKKLNEQESDKQKNEGWVTVDRQRYLDAIAR